MLINKILAQINVYIQSLKSIKTTNQASKYKVVILA